MRQPVVCANALRNINAIITPACSRNDVYRNGEVPPGDVWSVAMRHFIKRENIKHFRSLLETTIDENKRKIILKLLAEEEAKDYETGANDG